MRVLFDSCVYDLRNKGNVAMLQAAVNKIHDFWPEATLEVITSAPYLLRLYCPNARPISPTGIDYREHRTIFDIILRKIPVFLLRIMLELREAIWQRTSRNRIGVIFQLQNARTDQEDGYSRTPENKEQETSYNLFDQKALDGISLYVATGGHYLTDVMNYDVKALLERLELAIKLRVPIVMVSQGIGPILDPELYTKARAILPKVDLILIRENLEAPGILNDLGVDSSRVILAGDDAIEMACQLSPLRLGVNIGVGFRVAHTTEANSVHMDILKSVLHKVVSKYKCRLIGLPVSQSAHELDQLIIERISSGSRSRQVFLQKLSGPQKVIRDTSLCRLVVTGTYHTAVFALSQGIPVIGLVKAASYINKFAGLSDQFKGGMEIFQLDDESLEEKLLIAIDKAWYSAEALKPSLLEAGRRQIKLNQEGYQSIYQTIKPKLLVGDKKWNQLGLK